MLIRVTAFIFILIVVCAVWFYTVSQAKMSGEISLSGLQKPVTVSFDRFANPVISADSKVDAYLALGYLTARERMFQMDLMRRKMAGRLSEVIGPKTLSVDIANRHLGFSQLAQQIVKNLPEQQRLILNAYVQGVNDYLQTMGVRPVEFLALGYKPEVWRPEDSLLVSLAMFQLLNENNRDERMITVMNAALPADVLAFLTPDSDIYSTQVLLQGVEPIHDLSSIPIQSLSKLVDKHQPPLANSLVESHLVSAGSNQWAINKTTDGRAIMANDMHLPLSVPGIWYQADLRYQDVRVKGITLPGVPLMIAGSNGSLAWGFTNAHADVLDLVQLTINPDNPDQYLTDNGWQSFKQTTEIIRVKGKSDHQLITRKTRWGPLSPELLMGQPVAVQWSIYQSGAANLDLMAIDDTHNLHNALDLFNQAGLPPLNVILADNQGQIAWTLTGKMPKRLNYDGSISEPRDQGHYGWDGFIDVRNYPRVINPPSGLLMTANNRVLPKQYGFEYGQNFANSYRAYRIQEWLRQNEPLSTQQMHTLQLDTRSQLYEFYQQLVLAVLTEPALLDAPELVEVKQALQQWNGYADSDSIGYGLLVEFRQSLADTLFSSYLQSVKQYDQNFRYRWHNLDTPLRSLLTVKNPQTLPGDFDNWDELILSHLQQTAAQIKQRYIDSDWLELTWGKMETVSIQHPFGRLHAGLGLWLNMPAEPQSGCPYCVRVANGAFGASMRLVVSPGYEDEMILISSTGQSGNPLSAHYKDQYDYWVQGLVPEQVEVVASTPLILIPDR